MTTAAAALYRSRLGDDARTFISEIFLLATPGRQVARGVATRCLFAGAIVLFGAVVLGGGAGCGSTKSRTASEQLLMSDAVDRAVSQIDFRDLAGQKVFFETKYLVNTRDPLFPANQKGLGFVNAEYIISSLRQQMVTADLRLQEKVDDADFVVEARIGAVGFDSTEVVYGIPASAPLSSAATTLSGTPVPTIPEISFARKNIQLGAAKVGVFAYDRRTRSPVWQSGIAQAVSDARDSWLFGVGPFQDGSIYKGTQFEGQRQRGPGIAKLPPIDRESNERAASFLYDAPSGSAPRDGADRLLIRPDGSRIEPSVQPASTLVGPANSSPPSSNAPASSIAPAGGNVPAGGNAPAGNNPAAGNNPVPAGNPPPSKISAPGGNSAPSTGLPAVPGVPSAQTPANVQGSMMASAALGVRGPAGGGPDSRTSVDPGHSPPGIRADSTDLDVANVLASDSLEASWRSLLESARSSVRGHEIEQLLDRSFATVPALLGPAGLSSAWPADDTAGTGEAASDRAGIEAGETRPGASDLRGPGDRLAGSKLDGAAGEGQGAPAWHAPPDAGPLRFPFPLELPDTVGKSWPLRVKKRSL